MIDSIVHEYKTTNLSSRDLGAKYGVSSYIVLKILKDNDVDVKSLGLQKMSSKMKGKPSSRKGAILSKETIEKMVASRLGKPGKKGYRFTDEQKANMRMAALRRLEKDPDHVNRASSKVKKISPDERKKRMVTRSRYKNLVRRLLSQSGFDKRQKCQYLLKYSCPELRLALEEQFYGSMSFEVRESFHIDHIVPIRAFIERGLTDPSIVNAICNLRPLTASENRAKRDLYDDSRFDYDLGIIINDTLTISQKRSLLLKGLV